MLILTVLYDDGTRFDDGAAWIDDLLVGPGAATLFDDGTRFAEDGTSWMDD